MSALGQKRTLSYQAPRADLAVKVMSAFSQKETLAAPQQQPHFGKMRCRRVGAVHSIKLGHVSVFSGV